MGANGLWFIDPYDINIVAEDVSKQDICFQPNDIDGNYSLTAFLNNYGYGPSGDMVATFTTTLYADQIELALDNGIDVSISTGSDSANKITFYTNITSANSYPYPTSDLATKASLTLTAGTIDFKNYMVTSTSHKLDLILNATTILNFDQAAFKTLQSSYFYSDAGMLYINYATNTDETEKIIASVTNELNDLSTDLNDNTADAKTENETTVTTYDTKLAETQKITSDAIESKVINESTDEVYIVDEFEPDFKEPPIDETRF